MPAPVEPFVVITSAQVVALAVALGIGASGIVAATMKWSFSRNMKTLDDAITGLREDFKKMSDKQHTIEMQSVQKNECTICRQECQTRIVEYQRITIENDRIQNQKLDNLLLMVANVNNGMGGVKNGLSSKQGE